MSLAAPPPSPDRTPSCQTEGEATSTSRLLAEELQRNVNSLPLFLAAAKNTTMHACNASHTGISVELLYGFQNGNQYSLKHDPAIEWSEQHARLRNPPIAEDPGQLLSRAEQRAFGAQGCGIDWQQPGTVPLKDGLIEKSWRGKVCNCRASVRHDKSGGLMELSLSSAC